MGRKTKYNPELCLKAQDCMSQGMTLKEASKFLNVHLSKICVYMNKYSEFSNAIEKGRTIHFEKRYIEYLRDYIPTLPERREKIRIHLQKELHKLEKKYRE